MNRVFVAVLKSLCVAAVTMSSLVHAEEAKTTVKADPAKGEALFANGDATRNVVACVACHGAAGNSAIVQNPKLAGQHEAYIYKQLTNFKGPDRNNAVMTNIAKALTDDDMKNIAAYLDAQSIKPGAAKNKGTVELGKKIYRGGIAEKNVPACAACRPSASPRVHPSGRPTASASCSTRFPSSRRGTRAYGQASDQAQRRRSCRSTPRRARGKKRPPAPASRSSHSI